MWESRHGFPAPSRLPGGHRRYSEQDVAAVLEVLRLREQGLSLPAAIERAGRQEPLQTASMFAGLRRLRPEVPATNLPKRAVLQISHAIEDEYCAHAGRGLILGSFQREIFYRRAQRRWRELARTATLAVAMADFTEVAEPPGAPAEVPVEVANPLAREWTLIVDAPGTRACLAAWELPGQEVPRDADRRFEIVWSFEPEVVGAAVELAGELLWNLAPSVARRMPAPAEAGTTAEQLRFATDLSQRMVAYLGALVDHLAPGT